MKIIPRLSYLKRLIQTIQTPDIKVITGIRRAGKSKLLESFIEYVTEHIQSANIIRINFNVLDTEPLTEYHALYRFIEDRYMEGKENFLFIDEVQMCRGFEKTVNALHASEKYHIYITGSNAFLLSSDLATLFTGRTFEIHVFPFSFNEFLTYFEDKENDIYAAFDTFVRQGGMSGSYPYQQEKEKYTYITSVFETLIVRDIRQKYKIRNPGLLEKLADFLMDTISSEVSTRNLANTLTSHKEKTNDKSVGSYLQYLTNAYAFYKVRRYDIHGKKYLASQDKYYLCDHAFRYAKLGTKNLDFGRMYENIVAIELLRRGYEVYTGVLYKKEVDFVAIRRDEKIYIQVSDDITNAQTFERETAALFQIKDAYPKMLIARTRHEQYQYEGVRIVDIADWLRDDV
ncbi:ATP-binding protein [Treponema vincentii]|uniref:ATP-binding protein n=1 Tax=Treponema vincentii TaxID=69710 RepID=UPI0020A28DC9|nr:ATP-binding protein [Treponema vincentii]UTC48129.1 ATP-binding protein [Treponema vincentii]